MTIEQQWPRFVRAIKNNMPHYPVEVATRTEAARSHAGQLFDAVSSLLDGLNRGLSPGHTMTAATLTANSGSDIVGAAIDTAITEGADHLLEGAEAGPFVGGLLSILRGTTQAVERSDQTVHYLLSLSGYINGLARCSVRALHESVPYTGPLPPGVPRYIQRQGGIYNARTRRAFDDGVHLVMNMVREMDSLRPARGESYSRLCFIELAWRARRAQINDRSHNHWRLRTAIETHITHHLLRTDLLRIRNQLRHWANAA